MRMSRFLGLTLLALLISLIPATASAEVIISVGFAPPPLPVYVQPPCPEPGWMWTPGYWAYGPDGYFWVPGTWVPAPYEGALWTPGYWGWSDGMYLWHRGYWGPHVGYYGGVNYGFGFFGIGFVGGGWHGHVFAYNTAVVNVNRTYIHETYEDRTVIVHNTIVNDRHVAYAGGPGGINHPPAPEERFADRDQHMQPTSFQEQHRSAAMQDHGAYFNNNHGRPNNTAMERPMNGNPHGGPGGFNNNTAHPNPGYNGGPGRGAYPQNQGGQNQGGQNRGGWNNPNQAHPQEYNPHNNPQPQMQPHNNPQQMNVQHNNPQPQIQQHGNPQPQSHEPHNNPQPQQHGDHGDHEDHGHDHGHDR